MTVSGVSVYTDQTNYSRYDELAGTIQAHVEWTGSTAGDQLQVAVNRLDGYGLFSAQTVTAAGGAGEADLNFPLESLTDAGGYYRGRSGYYTVQVTDGLTVWASEQFTLSVISVRQVRDEWCKGLTLNTSETLEVLTQPQLVTGVTVDYVQQETFRDVFPLAFDKTANTLTWNAGTPVSLVNVRWNQQLTLFSRDNMDYIRVRVRPSALPATSVTESLLVDRRQITDEEIVRWVWTAQDWLERKVWVSLEPCLKTTDEFLPDYNAQNPDAPLFRDRECGPVPWETRPNLLQFLELHTPVMAIEKLYGLFGSFNTTKIVQIDQNWQDVTKLNGQIQLVPRAGALLQWQFFGGFFFNILVAMQSIPNFWQYGVMSGAMDLHPGSRWRPLLEALGKKVAVEILTIAGLHSKPGYQAESIARDGVSSSVAWATGAGGIYATTIGQYQQWLTAEVDSAKLRNSLLGPVFWNL